MYTNLLTIDNTLFTVTPIAAPPASKPNTLTNTTQFSSVADDIAPPSHIPGLTRTDNKPFITQNESINTSKQDFRHTLRKTTATEVSQQDQNNTKPKEQDPASHTTVQPDIVQSWLAQYRQTVQKGKEGIPTITNIKPKAGYELAQLLTNLKADKSPPVTGNAAKSAEIKLLLTTDKGQLGLKTVLPETSNGQIGLKTILPETSEGQLGSKTVLSNIPEGIADTQHRQGKNNDNIPISNSTVATTKSLTNGENTKKLMTDSQVDADGKTTTTDEKTTQVDSSVVAGSPKSPVLSGTKPGTNTLTDDDSKTPKEKTTIKDKSAIPGNPKTTALNSNLPPVQAKFIEPLSEAAGTISEKSAQIAAKPSDSKAATAEIVSESSSNRGKESPRAGNKLSDSTTVQELKVTEIQASIGQTKNRGSSTSNDSPCLYREDLKRILLHNNAQTPVTEQSHNSVAGAIRQTAGLPGQNSHSSVFADIGKQILESIHRSLSQEGQDQQITIRLNPPELGKVFIKFNEQDSQIIGLLEVSKPQTRIEIQQALPQIIQNLQDSGIHIKRLEVVLSEGEQAGQEALKDQYLQNGWTQQQDSTNSYTELNNPGINRINEWLINNHSYENISELQGALITDSSINMLA